MCKSASFWLTKFLFGILLFLFGKAFMENLIHNHDEYFKLDFLTSELSKDKEFSAVSDIFALLADSTRLKIFWLLCHSKECVQNIASVMKMTMPAVSHHLRLLKDSGLIECYRDGKEVFYTAVENERGKILHGIIEKLMVITCPDFKIEHEEINENSEYLENQVETIKQVHDFLLRNISRRVTIEDLARQFAMNTTTLKTVFKDVYGTSIAAHIKMHRMEEAARLLQSSDLSINEVALRVGYESQSKFSAVFKEFYDMTPAEYRKQK